MKGGRQNPCHGLGMFPFLFSGAVAIPRWSALQIAIKQWPQEDDDGNEASTRIE
jgi:hypothetical protein